MAASQYIRHRIADGQKGTELKQVKIANILLESTAQFFAVPQLYVHADAQLAEQKNSWLLDGLGTFDFTTFFNGLSVIKYDAYTSAVGYTLHLELKGRASVWQTCAGIFDFTPRREGSSHAIKEAGWQVVEIPLRYERADAICGFVIETEGPVEIRNSYYAASVPEDSIRPVELALSTTTFKKEAYITHNIELVRDKILGSDEDIARHFRMFVVDNGRMLDAKALSGEGITVFPNRNVGGSGGFAYGMIKALETNEVTHILLMDDDVEVSPESIKRTYQLLTILNEEYQEAFVSGAMMNADEPDLHWEDIGFMTASGACQSYKPVLRMSILRDCLTSETYHPATEVFDDLQQQYAAWWYCCIPISTIRKNGLPLPVFVRFDDVEYGLRSKPKIITLNGICIWHDAFYMRYNAGVERYQTARNGILAQSVTGIAPYTDFTIEIKEYITTELLKFNYADAELVCQGFEDYLKGPGFFMQKDTAEKTFMDANKNKEGMMPLSELKPRALDELGIDIDSLSADDIVRDIPLGAGFHGKGFNVYHTQLFRRSLNGQLFGNLKPFEGPTQTIEGVGWSYQPGKLYGTNTLLVINISGNKGTIRHRDNERCRAIWKRFTNDLEHYRRNEVQIKAAYAGCRDTVTSIEYWKDYLGI